VSLTCSDFVTCGELFENYVVSHLVPQHMTDLVDNESEAEYLATSSSTSSSALELLIDNPPGPSSESNWVGGRIEYTAHACGGSTCPFYLGNLTVTNGSDVWDLYSDAESDDVDIENIKIRLRRPVLGIWRPSTNEVYLGDEMLDLVVEFDVTVGGGPPTSMTVYATNNGTVFGELDNDAVEFLDLTITDGDWDATLDLDFDSVDGKPPTASITLASTVTLPTGVTTLPLSNITETSSDPDNDLEYKLWIIDGTQVGPDYEMGLGSHTVRLEVRDERYALDSVEQTVSISN
jgi:hypothetical protein